MRSSAAILWGSAIIVTALVLVTAGRLPESPAHASMATNGTGGFSLVTAKTGFGPAERPYEVLLVIDSQTQMFYVYGVENATDRRILLRGGANLPTLFRAARGG
ncbi:MAG: hypothetical protein SGJ11_02330 [Phycisphaerae bacterium]|nr:hypothetical protein [Phycisphaerae bacterium]